MKPWAQRTAALIKSGEPIPEPIIRKMRSIFAGVLNGRKSPSCTDGDAVDLMGMVELWKPPVTEEQAAKGLAHLRGLCWTPKGALRQTEAGRQFTLADRLVLDNCTGFYLAGFHEVHRGRYLEGLHPIYCCYSKKARFFYIAPSWQSGHKFEVTTHA